MIIPGFHNCSLCPDPDRVDPHEHTAGTLSTPQDPKTPPSVSAYSRTLRYQHYWVTMGAMNLFIPGNGVIYASPSLILHYILEHQYAPPLPFQEAVLNCPPMRSTKYFEEMDEIADKWWWLPTEQELTAARDTGFPLSGGLDAVQWLAGKKEEFYEVRETLDLYGGGLVGRARSLGKLFAPDAGEGSEEEARQAIDKREKIRRETISRAQCIAIPLKKVEDYYYAGAVADPRCLGRSRWIFGIHTKQGDAEIIASTPRMVKICSLRFVSHLVRRAMPGMAMTHLPVAPSAIPTSVGFQYFSVRNFGPCWDDIANTRQVGLYVAGELADPALELLVILDA